MRPLDIPFDGSGSLFRTQQSLVSVAEHVLWLPHFTLTRLHHLRFVHHLLQTFYELDICCALTGIYPAYIAGVLTSYYRIRPVIARIPSTILDIIYRKADTFLIGPFQFCLTEWEEYEGFLDYSTYITFEDVTVCFFSCHYRCLYILRIKT